MEKISPAVSVVIPMFNAEKYLPVCLESLLIQTFADFEVIVVDDCSPDQSLRVAESYLARVGGRLKIVSLPENTGSGAVPRNVGLDFARGKYVYFMDSDDLLIDVALEKLYNFAQTYRAEVVYFDRGFKCDEEPVPQDLIEDFWNLPAFAVEEPTFEPDDIAERVKKFIKLAFGGTPWSKFLRRSLLVDNAIKFPVMRISEDSIWTFKLLCLAKKILRVPEPLYVYRSSTQSMMKKNRSHEQTISFWTSPLIHGPECLNDFMDGFDVFNQPNDLRLSVLHFFVKISLFCLEEAFKSLTPHEAYKVFLREFVKAGSSQPALISYLLVLNNLYRNELMK